MSTVEKKTNVVRLENLWEKYRIKFVIAGKVSWEEIWALQDVSLSVDQGEVVGIIGQNGAGKTTLLRLIAGMLVPDKGKIDVEGRVSAIMELGAGFNLEFTGRENIVLNARAYGLAEDSIEKKIEEIVAFSGLGKFVDAPIKYYSQGMYMRLAFALAIFADPDILLIDDILAVGDEEAQQNCIKKIFELKKAGKTIVVVSHDMNTVSKLCDRTLLLEKGRIIQEGLPAAVVPYYLETAGNKKGICALENGNTRVVFNNGKLFLSYGGSVLSGRADNAVAFFSPQSRNWFSSSALNWAIEEPGRDHAVVRGTSADGTISQVWKIRLEGEDLSCQVAVTGGDIKEPHMDLTFGAQYLKYATSETETDFPNFFHRTEWQEFKIKDRESGLIGLVPSGERPDFPCAVIKSEDKNCLPRVLNTGYELESRIVQMNFNSQSACRFSVRFFKDKKEFKKYLEKIKTERLAQSRIESERLISQRSLSSGNTRLFVDSENKAVRLYYKDKEITKFSGVHASFLCGDRWYDLSSSELEVRKENEKLMLGLDWRDLGLVQTWELFLNEDNLSWKASSSIRSTVPVEELKFGILLRPEYQNLFCGRQQEVFPAQFTGWENIVLHDPHAELFGLRKQGDLPAVVFENKEENIDIIQNSDPGSPCRALQLSLAKEKIRNGTISFAASVRFSEEERFIDDYLKAESEKFIFEHSISSGRARVFFDPDRRTIRLYFRDRELSGPEGGISTPLPLRDTDLNFRKISEKQMRLTLRYGVPKDLFQIWDFSFAEDGTLEVVMKIENPRALSLKECSFRLDVNDVYERWITGCEQDDFQAQAKGKDLSFVRLRENKTPKVVFKAGPGAPFPSVALEICQFADQSLLSLFKTSGDEKNSYVSAQFSRIIPYKATTLPPGNHVYFRGKISFNDEKIEDRSADPGCRHALQKGKLEVVFANGKGAIRFNKKELTCGLGIYTSLRSSDIWFDSYQASWELVGKSEHKLTILGQWPHVPISQTWEIELKSENKITWKVGMEVYDKFSPEITQSNLMLSSDYKNWKAPGTSQGLFVDEYTEKYDILPFRFWSGTASEVGVSENGLPGIKFKNNSKKPVPRGVIENTDTLYRARLLQFQREHEGELPAGKCTYFEGEIEIEA